MLRAAGGFQQHGEATHALAPHVQARERLDEVIGVWRVRTAEKRTDGAQSFTVTDAARPALRPGHPRFAADWAVETIGGAAQIGYRPHPHQRGGRIR